MGPLLSISGVLLTLLNSDVQRSYSVLSLGSQVASSSGTSPGVIFIQVTYYLFVIAIPLLYMLNLFLLWSVRMSVAVQRGLFITAEVLNAWGSLEVFVVSLIAAILEITQFAAFIVGDRCDQVNIFLADFSHIFPSIYPPTDSFKCFNVETSLDSGCCILFAASLMVLVFGLFVLRACQLALNERIMSLSFVRASLSLAEDGAIESSDSSDEALVVDNSGRSGCSYHIRPCSELIGS